jgi:hypothetical protein
MLLVLAVRLPLCLPKGIGALLDQPVIIRVHPWFPQFTPAQLNLCRLRLQNTGPLVWGGDLSATSGEP